MEWSTNHKVKSTLPVLPINRFNTTRAPIFNRPLLIGDFSLDEQRNFHHDNRNMCFMILDLDRHGRRTVNFDLDQSMDKVRRKSEECHNEKLTNLLSWILLNKNKFALLPETEQDEYKQATVLSHADKTSFKGDKSSFRRSDSTGPELPSLKPEILITGLSTDFVCYRGLLRGIMCSPYDYKDGWIFLATKFRGTIYLCGAESAEKKRERLNESDRQKQMCSWGLKFEHFMTEGSDPREGNDESKEYCCILRSRLGSHSLVFGAEVDGVESVLYDPPHAVLTPFVELKTSKEISSARQEETLLKFKFQKWWSQSFLVGIPRVVCGFRDDAGIVRTLKSFEVGSLPDQAKGYWSPNVMTNFMDQFLGWVKKQVVEDNPNVVYKLTRKPGSRDVVCQCLGENSPSTFMPQWYVDKIFAK